VNFLRLGFQLDFGESVDTNFVCVCVCVREREREREIVANLR
jgi:hypothetical protein